jgi:hypothetical protein
MSYLNPYYNPAWREMQDKHFAAAKRAESEMERLAAGGAETYDAYKAMEAEFKRHHQAGMSTYKMQHKTVQEYAAWVFGSFNVSMNDHGGGIPVPQVDFERLRTIEEVDAEWSRIHGAITDSANERRDSLPAGKPEGIEAFSDVTSPGLTRSWRQFTPRELYPVGYPSELGVRTLMSVDEREDGWHVCFMHDWRVGGGSVTNSIERLATAVYREAHAIGASQAPPIKGVLAFFERWQEGRKRAAMLDPGRFHFYEHTPPAPSGSLKESFAKVGLYFEKGEFANPDWRFYPVIPHAIQSARFDCALDAEQLGTPGQRAISDQCS